MNNDRNKNKSKNVVYNDQNEFSNKNCTRHSQETMSRKHCVTQADVGAVLRCPAVPPNGRW